jgi:Uma2 family endonuclease
MVQTPTKSISLEEFLKLPETKPANEYVNGQIIQKPMPQGKHSRLQGELVNAINASFKPQRIAEAFPELRCTFGGRSIVPDVAVFTWSRIPVDENGEIANVFPVAPDWTIEILSPDQNQSRVTSNILHCIKHGAKFGWLLDPDIRAILTFNENQQTQFFEEPSDVLPVPDFAQEIQLTIDKIFGWLKV